MLSLNVPPVNSYVSRGGVPFSNPDHLESIPANSNNDHGNGNVNSLVSRGGDPFSNLVHHASIPPNGNGDGNGHVNGNGQVMQRYAGDRNHVMQDSPSLVPSLMQLKCVNPNITKHQYQGTLCEKPIPNLLDIKTSERSSERTEKLKKEITNHVLAFFDGW